ncbi:HEAT repeat domain-containing protein [candidate division WOR-3 bacterium]|nr:HEAT repeat domain-containing protein [candidate division WOR-3 bacterium]
MNILKSDNIERKLKILDKIDGVDEKQSIKILIKMLEDRSWCMREKAANRLVAYGPRISSRLQRLLKKGYWYTRASACMALGEIGDAHAIEPIIALYLTDENPTVLKEACGALVKLAQKKTKKFAQAIQRIQLLPGDLQRILLMLEKNDIELRNTIKKLTANVDE